MVKIGAGATGINGRTSLSPFMKFYTVKARNVSSPDDSDRKDDQEHGESRIPNDKDEEVINSEILNAALKYVNTKGWTMEAIRAGNNNNNIVNQKRKSSSFFIIPD